MTDCKEHHFGSNGRCKFCKIRSDYYAQAMIALRRWSERKIEDDPEYYKNLMDNYQCKPHTHDENPLLKLYDMEDNQI